MATKKTSSKKPNLKLVPKTPKTTPADREAIIQEVLDATTDRDILPLDPPTEIRDSDARYPDSFDENIVNNHFAFSASQVNVDFALAADCEASGDFGAQDNTWLDFFGSTEYGKLRRTFLEDVKANLTRKSHRVDALLNAVYRAYYAGQLSPERKEPDSSYDRIQRWQRRDERLKIPATK